VHHTELRSLIHTLTFSGDLAERRPGGSTLRSDPVSVGCLGAATGRRAAVGHRPGTSSRQPRGSLGLPAPVRPPAPLSSTVLRSPPRTQRQQAHPPSPASQRMDNPRLRQTPFSIRPAQTLTFDTEKKVKATLFIILQEHFPLRPLLDEWTVQGPG